MDDKYFITSVSTPWEYLTGRYGYEPEILSVKVITSKYDIVQTDEIEYNHNMNIYEIIKGE